MSTQANLREKSVTPDQLLVPQSGNNNTSLAYIQNRIGGGGGGTLVVATAPCYAATSANVALTGALSSGNAHGATVPNGSRLLVANQTDHTENGPYDYNNAGAWTRTVDAITAGMKIPVLVGPTGDIGASTWTCTNTTDPVVGTDAIDFALDKGSVPDSSITPAKLSFDPATQAELDAHAAVVASTTVLGHVKIDGVTVTKNGSNQLVAATGGDITVRAVVTYDFTGNDEVPHGLTASHTDGLTLTAGEYALILGETDQTYNDVWSVASGSWTRAPISLKAGSQIQVMSGGATAAGRTYYCRNTTDPNRGTDTITFALVQTQPAASSVGTAQMASDAATNANLANMPQATIKLRPAGAGTGDPVDGTANQASTILDAATDPFVRTSAIPSGAPTSADYLVKTANGSLSAERVVTDTASIAWDWAAGGQAQAKRAALTGDVTAAADSNTTTIANDAVTPAMLSSSVAGSGLTGGSGSALAVNTDGATLEISADTVRVKAGSIGATQLDTTGAPPGSYKNVDITISADGRITAISDGSGGMIFSIMLGATGITVPGSSTRYIGLSQTTAQVNESSAVIHLSRAGKFRDMLVYTTGSQPNDGSLAITTRDAGADTTVVCTVAANAAGGIVQDATHTSNGAATDTFCFKLVNNSILPSITINEIHVGY